MKKTQSLKLMLLGLMASVSTGAFAEVGDIFAYGGEDRTTQNANGILYYEEIADGVKLVGVQTVGTGNVIVIPTTVYNSWYGAAAQPLNVVEVEDNWYASTQIVLKKFNSDGTVAQQTPMSDPTLPLTDYNDLTLQIDAANLKTIGTDALQPLNKSIKKFVVSAGAGLTAIPDYAFINGTKSMPTDAEAIAKKKDEIKALKASIANSQECIVKEGKYNGTNEKYQGYQVYKLLYNSQNAQVPGDDPKYVIIDQTATPVADGNKQNYPLLVITAAGDVQSAGGATARVNKSGNLVRSINNTVTVVGNPVAEDVEECLVGQITKDGLEQLNQKALTALQTAQTNLMAYEQGTETTLTKAYDDAKAAYDAAVAMQQKMQTPAVANAWNGAETQVWNAIKNGSSEGLTNVEPSYMLNDYNTIYQALVDAKWPVNENGKFVLDDNDILTLNDAVNEKYNTMKEKEQALQTSLTNEKKPLQDALADAEKAYKEANDKLTKAQKDLAAAEDALEALERGAANYTVEGDNTTLQEVEWNNEKISYFGVSAFENCTKATFKNKGNDGAFTKVTEKIMAKAFKNTGINAILKPVWATINEIGDEAFANTPSKNVNLRDAVLLNDDNVGNNIWLNCPIEGINLKNTKMTEMPKGLAENILRGEEAKDCDNLPVKYVYTNEDDEPVEVIAKINSTLKSVVMPATATKIRDINFWFCENLQSIDMPAGITEIGEYALAGTKLGSKTEGLLDLTAQKGLANIGDGAFAFNLDLKKVTFNTASPFKTLEGDVFACDENLEEVTLNDDIECLGEGIFADSKIKELDLSKTKLQVLYNLFGTGEDVKKNGYDQPFVQEYANTTLKKILLPDLVLDEKDNYTVKNYGLKVIMPDALAYMQGLTEVTIPSTVEYMGDGVFYNCLNLETVTAMDSKLTTFGVNTFRNCRNLKTVTFVTLNVVQPYGKVEVDPNDIEDFKYTCGINMDEALVSYGFVDANNFFATRTNGEPTLILTQESKDALWTVFNTFNISYANLEVYEPVMQMPTDALDMANGYFNANYGTWIHKDDADVYVAYQDKQDIYMIKQRHNQGYYKIPAATLYDPDEVDLTDVEPMETELNEKETKKDELMEEIEELADKIDDLEDSFDELPEVKNNDGFPYDLTDAEEADYAYQSKNREKEVLEEAIQNIESQLNNLSLSNDERERLSQELTQRQSQYDKVILELSVVQTAVDTHEKINVAKDTKDAKETLLEELEDDIAQLENEIKETTIENLSQKLSSAETVSLMYRPGINGVYNHGYWAGTYLDWYMDGVPSIDRPLTPSAACIIVSKSADGKVKYQRHSTPDKKWQSTLDPANMLRGVGTPLDLATSTTSSNIYQFGYPTGGAHSFYRITSGVIPAGKVVIPTSAAQGNSRLNIIWVDDEATTIMGVKEYVKSLTDADGIYNLQGVRVSAPVKGQVYVKGGKKFIQQ